MPIISSLKALQSGGFADVVLNQDTGVCFKIFHRRGDEDKEFKIVEHLLDLYEESNSDKPSRVVKFIDYGYLPKEAAREMYEAAYPNDQKKLSEFSKNFEKESYVPYIAMEYINGIDGLDYCLKYGSFDEPTAVRLMISLLLSLQEFHEMGLIHRDVKPDNFMVFKNEYGQQDVKLIDLGLAIKSDEPKGTTVAGTKVYLAPEAADGFHSAASDLFSAGLSFYRLCGSPKDFSSRFMKLLLKVTDNEPRRRGTILEAIQTLRDIQEAL